MVDACQTVATFWVSLEREKGNHKIIAFSFSRLREMEGKNGNMKHNVIETQDQQKNESFIKFAFKRCRTQVKHTFFSNSRALDCNVSYDSPVRDTPDETPRS